MSRLLLSWRPALAGTLLLVMALVSLPVFAQSQGKTDPAIEAAMKAASPGPAHAELAKRAGTYVTLTKSWLQPGAAPIESKGTARLSVILDGRYLQEENDGDTMGFPYKGLRIIGYNNASQKYEGVWYYTGSTATMVLTGVSKDKGKTIDWAALFEDQKGVKVALHATTVFVNADRFVVDLTSTTPQGAAGPRFETTYTRQR